MTTTPVSSRRSFIRTAGSALSAPLAVAAVTAPALAGAAVDGDPLQARLARLEDVNAIRALSQSYARHLNAGAREELAALFSDPADEPIDPGIRAVTAESFGAHDVIDVRPDRQTATAMLHCTVDAESAIGPDCPLVGMARQQGGGVARRTEQGVFEQVYVRRDGAWKIQRSTYRPA